jgi:predicted nucleotide-binding protein
VTAQAEASWPLALLGQPDPGGTVVIDSATLDQLADALGLDARDVSVRMRSLIDVHQPLAPFEMRSGAWRVELAPAVAKGIIAGLVGATVLQLADAVNVPFVVLGMVAGLLMQVEQVEVAEADVVVHARLRQVVSDGAERSLTKLYHELPADARDELPFDEFAAIALRLHEVGMVRWTATGVRLRDAGPGRGLRLMARRPSDADIAAQLPPPRGAHPPRQQGVFVIHGRDDEFVGKMYEFLSLVGLRPMEWEPLVGMAGHGPAPVLHDVIRNGMREAQAIIALLTPDDVVQLHPDLRGAREDPHELAPACQPRPNVLMELGIALYAYRQRTVVVKAGSFRPIADLGGINYVAFDGGEASRAKLVERLRLAGCSVDDRGTEWRRQSRFAGLDVFSRGPK